MRCNCSQKKYNATVWTAVMCAVISTVLAFLCLPKGGIVYTHDSLAYLHVEKSLAAGEGFLFFGYSTPMIQWALLMPAFCAFLSRLTGDAPATLAWLNLIFMAVTMLLANLTAVRIIKKKLYCVAAQVILSFSWTMWFIHYHLWSEALFLLFVTALIYVFVCWLQEKKRYLLVAAGVFASLMLLTRFSGMELAGLIGLIIVFYPRHTWKNRIMDAAAYGVIGAVPCVALLIRNYMLSGTFTGRSKPALYTFSQNLKDTCLRLVEMLDPAASGWRILLVVGIVGVMCLAALVVMIRQRDKIDRDAILPVIFMLLHCVLYTATSLYANSTYALDGVTGRIMAPIMVCGFVMIFWVLSQITWSECASLPKIMAVCVVLLTVFSASSNIACLVHKGPDLVNPYSKASYGEDAAAEYIAAMDPDAVKVWTNQPARLYVLTDGMDINYPPRRESIELYSWEACVARWQESEKELYVCWYDRATNQILYQEAELQERLGLVLVAELDGCRIYSVPE